MFTAGCLPLLELGKLGLLLLLQLLRLLLLLLGGGLTALDWLGWRPLLLLTLQRIHESAALASLERAGT